MPITVFAQSNSWDGKGISHNNQFRALNIFVNIIYDVHFDTNYVEGTDYWQRLTINDTLLEGVNVESTIPSYLLDFMDTTYYSNSLHGCVTRIYGESSFDSLQIIGDFIVVNIRESRVLINTHPNFFGKIVYSCIEFINENGGLQTLYGHNNINDYLRNNKVFFTQFLIRNITKAYGGWNIGDGSGTNPLKNRSILSNGNYYLFSGNGTGQCIGSGNIANNPTGIVPHEISHSLFGSNNFHTSGGNHRGPGCTMPFTNIQGGYGLMGAANSGLVSCNGYERWRMHWKHPDAPSYISARDRSNSIFLNSDIKKADGNQWFLLRDFVTYGDAIRIQLPYKDSIITPNQYIWLEFHNVGNNNKLDFLQYSNTTCLQAGTPGIYAYYQIGRDVLSGSSSDVWDRLNRDNLRIISNQGYWDYAQYAFAQDTDVVCTQWNDDRYYYVPELSNAFCGYQDQETFIVPKSYDHSLSTTQDSVFENGQFVRMKNVIREYASHNMKMGDAYITNSISFLGDSLDAFSSHRKMNMATNPSTCNAITYYSNNTGGMLQFSVNQQYNNQTTYLTGLSIEIIPCSDHASYWVKIRWDDYDVVDDARWTGKIVLKEQLNLKRGHTITLAQNRTPAQNERDAQNGYFAAPTLFTCESGSILHQEPHTGIILTEKSKMVLDSGCHYTMGDSSTLVVQSGSTFTVRRGADFQEGHGATLIVDTLGTLNIFDTAQFRSAAQIHIRPGGTLIVNGGTLTSACEGEIWSGIFVDGHPDQPQQARYQGRVILNNATIAHAHNAINTRDTSDFLWEHSGGIIQANNTLFLNNKRSVEFDAYENTNSQGNVTNNVSYFSNCTFRIDSNNYFAENNCAFINHISMRGVRGIKIEGCHFENVSGNAGGKAIYTNDAGYTVRRICPIVSNTDPCVCDGDVVRCSFSGFEEAVLSANANGQYDIIIDNCDFSNNKTAMVVNAVNNVQFSHNDCNLTYPIAGVYGLKLNSSHGYIVEGNAFYIFIFSANQAEGVICNNSGTTENSVHKNDFHNLHYGIRAVGNNGFSSPNIQPRGLQFTCNEFDANFYDIYVNASASIRHFQGSSAKGADNDFINTRSRSLTIPTSLDTVYYYWSVAANHNPISSGGYRLQLGSVNNCASTLCNNLPYNPGMIAGRNISPIDIYEQMDAEYQQRSQDFYDNNYDNILRVSEENADAIYSQDEILRAFSAVGQLSELSLRMAEFSNYYIKIILQDSVLNFAELINWYEHVNTTESKYLIIETYYQTGKYDDAIQLLEAIPEMYDLDTNQVADYEQYIAFHVLRNALINNESNDNHSHTWYQLTESEKNDLQHIAESGNSKAARMAQGVLCFFYDICYEDTDLSDYNQTVSQGRNTINVAPLNEHLRIYPNPVFSQLTIESSNLILSVTIYDMSGRRLLGKITYLNNISLNISNLRQGIYLLRVVTENGVERKSFVKR